MNEPLPVRIRNSFSAEEMTQAHGDLPANASYRYIDEVESIHVKNIIKNVLPQYQAMAGIPMGFSRNAEEMRIEFAKWYHAGAFAFSVGPETMSRIAERLKSNDIPTAPVPPAYFQFSKADWKYDRDKILAGAHISRGVNGKIAFVSDEAADNVDPTIIALPSVFRSNSLAILKRKLEVHRKPKITPQAKMMAESMARSANNGEDPGKDAVEAMAIHIQGMRPADGGEIQNEPQLDISAMLATQNFGPLKGRPGPLLMRAAQIVLIAADEARKIDKEYGAPEYLDTNMVARNQMEKTSQPVERRNGATQLP